jgi:hypothetical protein
MERAERERQREREATAGAGKRPVDGRGDGQQGERRGEGDGSLGDIRPAGQTLGGLKSPREPPPFFSADGLRNPSHPNVSTRHVSSRLATPPLGVGLLPRQGKGKGVHEVRSLSSNGLLLRNYPAHT